MTLTRPRLMASALCILIVLAVFYLVAASFRRSAALRSPSPALSVVEQSPPATSYVPAEPAMPPQSAVDAGPPSTPALREAGPNVGPTAAPGVAFNYRYAFRLAATRIAEVQERHAQMCERLTIARCRITGMLYRVVNDRDIEAMLALKVDPAVARLFGREAGGVVVQSEGMLTESEISGTDVGTAIRDTGRAIAEMEAELARIEARLRQSDLAPGERSQSDYDAQQLRQRIRAAGESRDRQQESLATTPMMFRAAPDAPSGAARNRRLVPRHHVGPASNPDRAAPLGACRRPAGLDRRPRAASLVPHGGAARPGNLSRKTPAAPAAEQSLAILYSFDRLSY